MKRLFIFLIICSAICTGGVAYAQETSEVKATIVNLVEEQIENGNVKAIIEVRTESGDSYIIDSSEAYVDLGPFELKEGDRVILQIIKDADGAETAFISDVVRAPMLLLVFLIFAGLTLLVGWLRGLLALLGLAVTVGVIFLFILPQILAGNDPVIITVIGAAIILLVNMHLAHGFNRQTLMAFVSTLFGLLLVVVFAHLFVALARLSGLGSEEAALLSFTATEIVSFKGLLLAGIILGAVGVLDDIAIAQSEAVAELRLANPDLTTKDLFTSAMRIGRHHIASTVNTLVLAYAGVAMPLFLLFLVVSDVDMWRFLNEPIVAEEIVRTLAGTAALVLTVPIATWFATVAPKR